MSFGAIAEVTCGIMKTTGLINRALFITARLTREEVINGLENPCIRLIVPTRCAATFHSPIVKVLISKDDPNAGGKVPVGGYTDQYIFRLAETYLNRAEARWWQGDLKGATEDVNIIRRRAKAPELPEGSVTLEQILDERARELFLEDHRKTELTRIAYLKAKLGADGYSFGKFL